MKKMIAGISALVLSVMCLTGCGGKEIDLTAASNTVLTSVSFAEQLQPASEKIALKRLGVDEADVESCIAYTSTNAVVDEFAIIKTTNPENVENAIQQHVATQIETYQSYAPNEVTKLNSAIVKTVGDCVVYVVSSDNASAQGVVDSLTK